MPKYLPENLPHFIKYGYDVLKFIGFNAKEGLNSYILLAMKNKENLKHILVIILHGVVVEEMFVLIMNIALYVEKV